MTHDFNMLLEQYNLANFECDGDYEDYYWSVAEWIGQTIFSHGSIHKSDLLELMCDLLEITEDDINVDDVDDFLDDLYEIKE